MFVISVQAFLCFQLVASALLAVWVVERLPRVGPRSLRSAFAFCIGALVLVRLLPSTAGIVRDLPHGAYAVLFSCAVAFFFAFLGAIWLIRSLAAGLGSSGGGPGHPARS
jgi:hypothetical protein